MNERLDQIEFRLAYLEQSNTTLSDTIIQQQKEIDALRAQLDVLLQRAEAAQSQPTVYTAEEEKPPHY